MHLLPSVLPFCVFIFFAKQKRTPTTPNLYLSNDQNGAEASPEMSNDLKKPTCPANHLLPPSHGEKIELAD